jgi:hypothetical protein
MASNNYIKDEELTKVEEKTIFIRIDEGYSQRRYTRGTRNGKKGRMITYARYLWKKYYPNDRIQEDENIHHKDFNPLNDCIENLVKLKKNRHKKIHEQEFLRRMKQR